MHGPAVVDEADGLGDAGASGVVGGVQVGRNGAFREDPPCGGRDEATSEAAATTPVRIRRAALQFRTINEVTSRFMVFLPKGYPAVPRIAMGAVRKPSLWRSDTAMNETTLAGGGCGGGQIFPLRRRWAPRPAISPLKKCRGRPARA